MQAPIGVIELYQHNEVLIHYCELLSYGDQHLMVFCNRNVFEELPDHLKKYKIQWYIREPEVSIPKFTKKYESQLRQCRFLLISTVFDEFKAFANLASWSKSALIMHSVHTWMSPWKSIEIRPKHLLRDIYRLSKFILNRQGYKRKQVLDNVDFIGVPNQRILNYSNATYNNVYSSKFVSIPFGKYDGAGEEGKGYKGLTFTITGSIGDDVRNYQEVYKALTIVSKKLKKRIRFILLGKPKNKKQNKTKEQFESLANDVLDVMTFSGFINQSEYDRLLKETDYLILPLKEYAHFIAFRELTCQSKLSGSVNDLIRLGKKALVSKYFTVDDRVDKFVTVYRDSNHLADQMLGIVDNEQDLTSLAPIEETFGNYKIDKLYGDIMLIIDG